MARGTTLLELVRQLRLETGRSATAVANEDAEITFKEKLRRTQEFYYDDYDWPFMQTIGTIASEANRRFYPVPSTMNMESITSIWVKDGGTYKRLIRGITLAHYNSFDSLLGAAATGTVTVTAGTSNPGTNKVTGITVDSVEVLDTAVDWVTSHAATAIAIAAQINTNTSSPGYTATASGAVVTITAEVNVGDGANTFVVAASVGGDVTTTDVAMASGVDAEQGDPIRNWEIRDNPETGNDEIEVWPVPSATDTLYLPGKKALSALSADSDTADLDDMLIVITLAAEILARSKMKDAEAKASMAQRRYIKMKARTRQDTPPFIIRGGTLIVNQRHAIGDGTIRVA